MHKLMNSVIEFILISYNKMNNSDQRMFGDPSIEEFKYREDVYNSEDTLPKLTTRKNSYPPSPTFEFKEHKECPNFEEFDVLFGQRIPADWPANNSIGEDSFPNVVDNEPRQPETELPEMKLPETKPSVALENENETENKRKEKTTRKYKTNEKQRSCSLERQRKEKRTENNRKAAKASRQRKTEYLESLEQEVYFEIIIPNRLNN